MIWGDHSLPTHESAIGLSTQASQVLDMHIDYAREREELDDTFIWVLYEKYPDIYELMQDCVDIFELENEEADQFSQGFALAALSLIVEEEVQEARNSFNIIETYAVIDQLFSIEDSDRMGAEEVSDALEDKLDDYVLSSFKYLVENNKSLITILAEYHTEEPGENTEATYDFMFGVSLMHDMYAAQRFPKDAILSSGSIGLFVMMRTQN